MVSGPRYDIDPDKAFRNAIADAISSGLDLSFSMGEAARIIKKDSTKNFILKGAGKYTPLSAAYAERKSILAPGAPMLVGAKPGIVQGGRKFIGGGISGRLRNSIVDKTSDSIIRIGKNTLEVGTSAKSKNGFAYPRAIQNGSSKMPARKFLFFSRAMVKQIMNTINADVANQI